MTDAVKAEAVGAETLTVDWRGLTVALPASVDDWDPDTLEAFEGGKAITALRGLLGSKAYEQARRDYAAAYGAKPTVGDLGVLAEAIAKAYGFEGAPE